MAETMKGVPFERYDVVRIGIVGVGGRGTSLLRDLLAVEGVHIVAVYDRVGENAQRAKTLVMEAGQSEPVVYTGDSEGYQALCERDDIDLVYVATAWDWHVPVAVYAMEHGKHAAVEVPAATTIEDCWLLVDTSERTRRHCMMLENCCYAYNEMLVNRLVHAGVLGELTHGEAAYIHDLRGILMADSGEGLWRREPHISKDGNLYPTHGLGPVAWYMDIHRGDRFAYMVSVSSMERSLSAYRDEHFVRRLIERKRHDPQDDILTALIQAEENGESLSEDELVSMVLLLIVAGYETTVHLITNSIVALLEHPDQLVRLREQPELMESAIEEVLRYVSPIQSTKPMYPTEDITFHDKTIPKGATVFPLLGAANHDPDVFENPEVFDISRSPNRHLGFGQGIHYCLGAPLARLETKIALKNVLQRSPNLRLAVEPGVLRVQPAPMWHRYECLPVVLG